MLLYGLEVLALTKVDERLLENTEMKMMRWIRGISVRQHRTNDDIRRLLEVTKISMVRARHEKRTRACVKESVRCPGGRKKMQGQRLRLWADPTGVG